MAILRETGEKMTYEEAADYLGKQIGTITHAVTRGVLTPLREKGRKAFLPRQQVELFKGKRLSKEALSKSELETWERLNTYKEVLPHNLQTSQISGKVEEVMETLESLTPEEQKQWALVGIITAVVGGLAAFPLSTGLFATGIALSLSLRGLLTYLKAQIELPKNCKEEDIDKLVASIPDEKERKKVRDAVIADKHTAWA